MIKRYILTIILLVALLPTGIYSLKMLEPITKDLTYTDHVDLGYFSADESFMVSFLLENGENYTTISLNPLYAKDAIVEQSKRTQESIFTIIKLDESLNGRYTLSLILSSEDNNREINLNMFITDDVIHTTLINYNPVVSYEKEETINFNIINKSNTTKKIKITSTLPPTWFSKKKKSLPMEKDIILQPNSITEQTYSYFPKEIGNRKFNLIIKSFVENQGKTEINENINYTLSINTKKNLTSIYGSKEHTYPLFNPNITPIYFLNKIIKII